MHPTVEWIFIRYVNQPRRLKEAHMTPDRVMDLHVPHHPGPTTIGCNLLRSAQSVRPVFPPHLLVPPRIPSLRAFPPSHASPLCGFHHPPHLIPILLPWILFNPFTSPFSTHQPNLTVSSSTDFHWICFPRFFPHPLTSCWQNLQR